MKRFKEMGAFANAILVVVGFLDFVSGFCSLIFGDFLVIFLGTLWLVLMSLFWVL
ncbi:putative membrane protein [Helicobacter pylori Hp A-27]|nr:putative membrane protein [Helicobacter pylori Hp A-27]